MIIIQTGPHNPPPLSTAPAVAIERATGGEVDFVIATPNRLLPIEIKSSAVVLWWKVIWTGNE